MLFKNISLFIKMDPVLLREKIEQTIPEHNKTGSVSHRKC